jgi:hypothetical protein
VADIPAGIPVGHLTYYVGAAVADSNDVGGRPDAILLNGTIVFTPMIDFLRFPTLDPLAETLILEQVSCTIVNSIMIGPGGLSGVDLVSSYQPDADPQFFQWKCEIALTGTNKKIPSFTFNVPANDTLDLTSVVPQARLNAVTTVVSTQDRILAQEAAADAQAIADSLNAGVGPMVEEYLAAHPPTGTTVADWNTLTNKPPTFPPSTHTQSISTITGIPAAGLAVLMASSPAEQRGLIGAGTSDLTLGTSHSQAMFGDKTFVISEIGGLVAPITTFLSATTAAGARSAIGATDLILGTTSTTAMRGDKTWTSADITDATTIGRQILTAANGGAVLTLIGGASTTALALKADDSSVVKLTGAQTIAGVKTYSSAPVVPNGSWTIAMTTGLQAALDGAASNGGLYLLAYDYALSAWPTVPATAPTGTRARIIIGPSPYTGATWTNIPDVELYGSV